MDGIISFVLMVPFPFLVVSWLFLLNKLHLSGRKFFIISSRREAFHKHITFIGAVCRDGSSARTG